MAVTQETPILKPQESAPAASVVGIGVDELKHALENDSIVLFYQPKVSMITGGLCGAEALARWIKPDGCIIPPTEFIPLAESSGLINELTLRMFRQLVLDFNVIRSFNDAIVVSINVSPIDFTDNRLVDVIAQATDKGLLPACNLEVEITESAILYDDDEMRRRIVAVHEMGVGLAMDDFGTGYSSIDTLSKWPFTAIKIDKGIIGSIGISDKHLTIAEASIQMGCELGVEIVAEGVETAQCYDILLAAGCSTGQGYWISRPLPLDQFIGFMGKEQRWPVDMVRMVYQAQLDHMKWRKAILEGVFFYRGRNNSSLPLRGLPETDPCKCRLGKWYYGTANEFAGKEWYDALEQPHRQLHELGAELLQAAIDGASQESLLPRIRCFTDQSILVTGLLQTIEHEMRFESGGHSEQEDKGGNSQSDHALFHDHHG
jgi:EAL domain-containing protein (putative c-di-GMP-specific phosphodiesterase class I)